MSHHYYVNLVYLQIEFTSMLKIIQPMRFCGIQTICIKTFYLENEQSI